MVTQNMHGQHMEEVSTANVALSVVQQVYNYSNTADCDMITIRKCKLHVACSYRSVTQ